MGDTEMLTSPVINFVTVCYRVGYVYRHTHLGCQKVQYAAASSTSCPPEPGLWPPQWRLSALQGTWHFIHLILA